TSSRLIYTLSLHDALPISDRTITHLLDELTYDYENTSRGFMLMNAHDYYYLTTKPEHNRYFEKLMNTSHSKKLTQAALETLAIIAYKQPVTRTEIEDVRGVKSDHSRSEEHTSEIQSRFGLD